MDWVLLLAAGLLEVCWAVGLKASHGFSRFYPSVVTLLTMALSFGCLSLSMRTLPLGTAYAVWTGIGTVGTVVVGMIFFGESTAFFRLLCLGLIIAGIAGLKLVGAK